IINNGPNPATDIVVDAALPAGMRFTGVVTGCPNFTGNVCKIPFLAPTANIGVDVEVYAFSAGTFSVRGGASAPQQDPDVSNNVSIATTVVAPAAVTYLVTNTNDSGTGSLRQAITDSNTNTGSPNTINFNIQPSGAKNIALATALPTITVPVVIDGTTQPGWVSGGPLAIQLDGVTTTGTGINISAGASTVRGLSIVRFATGVSLTGAGGNVLVGNYIGLNATGAKLANGTGISWSS